MNKKLKSIGLIICASLSIVSCADNKSDPVTPIQAPVSWNERAADAQASIWKAYWNSFNYRFNNYESGNTELNYFWQAQALDVLVDQENRTDSPENIAKVSYLYTGVEQANTGFIYDDFGNMEWMALATLRAYNSTKNHLYLNTAKELWMDIIAGWDTTAVAGGISTNKTEINYKNTPANAPAVILGARLFTQNNDSSYFKWSLKIYTWLNKTLVDTSSGLVWDGINRNNDGALERRIYTYNQGAYIGASLELFNITKDTRYLSNANKVMNAVLNNLVNQSTSILYENGMGDACLYKGILIRYVTDLIFVPGLDADLKTKYVNFIAANANSLWTKAKRETDAIFNSNWSAVLGSTMNNLPLSSQLSAAMLLESMAKLEKNNLLPVK